MYLFSKRPPLLFDKDDGSGDDPDESQDKKDKPTGGDDKGQGGKTFTQEQVDRLMADTRKEARKTVLKKAGYESEEDLLKAVDAYKKAETEKLSAAEKAEKERDDARAEADTLRKELQGLRFQRDFDKTVAMLSLEFQNEKARDVALKLLDEETASKGEKDMEEAVKSLTEEHSYLFIAIEEVDIDAQRSGKTNKKIVKKEVISEKKRNRAYHLV